jgi:Cu/Ag efflux protein CusF
MKKLILLVALLTLVAFVSGTLAQQKTAPAPAKAAGTPPPAPAPKLEKFSGVIDKVDEMAKAVVVKIKVKKEEKTMTFAVGDTTKITKGKETLSFGDLKNGMDVSVDYKKEGDKNIAATIKVAAPKAAQKKK